nr:ParB/RepB/Spo0J family partition protein [Arthrobacter agilis]
MSARTDASTADGAAGAAQNMETADLEPASATRSAASPGSVPRETGSSSSNVTMVRPDQGGSDASLIAVPGATFAELPLDSIHPNRKQPRVEFNEDELAELVHSIREIGVLQPVVVRPSQEGGTTSYELVMGERRWRASREAGMESIPAIIRSTLDDDLLRDALLENLHRSALNPLEEAAAYQQLLDDFGCSHDELAGRLGRSRPQISNTLRLMKLPPLVQRRVAAGVLSAGHARALLGLGDPADMEKLAQRIVAEGLSVRSTEEIVALSGGLRRATKPSTPRDGARHERLDYLATSLSDRLDTNVKITLGAKKGRVSIEFASVDDLNRIIGVLSPSAE